jgi:uncharacterized membrane protein
MTNMIDVRADLSKLISDIEPDFIKYEPVILAWALNGGLAVLLGDMFHITTTQEAAVTTIATGVVAVFTALHTKPFAATAFTGALTTVLVAGAAFGLHLPSQDIGVGVAILAAVAGLGLRANVSPVAAAPVEPQISRPNYPNR